MINSQNLVNYLSIIHNPDINPCPYRYPNHCSNPCPNPCPDP